MGKMKRDCPTGFARDRRLTRLSQCPSFLGIGTPAYSKLLRKNVHEGIKQFVASRSVWHLLTTASDMRVQAHIHNSAKCLLPQSLLGANVNQLQETVTKSLSGSVEKLEEKFKSGYTFWWTAKRNFKFHIVYMYKTRSSAIAVIADRTACKSTIG